MRPELVPKLDNSKWEIMTLGLAPTYKSTIINRINIFSLTTFYIYIKLLLNAFLLFRVEFYSFRYFVCSQCRSIRKLELDMFELLKSEHIHFSCNILNRVYIELENVHQNVINMRTCCNSERIFTINCILLGLKRISRRVEAVNHICAACQWNGLWPHLGCLAAAFQFISHFNFNMFI